MSSTLNFTKINKLGRVICIGAKNIFIRFICFVSKYFLISKKIGQDFAQYKGNALRLTSSSVTPSTVDEVVIGVRGDKKFKRKVTIFRDVKRNPIEKIFDYSDKPVLKNRVYSHETNFISSDEFVKSTNVKEYTLNRNIEPVARQKKVQDL